MILATTDTDISNLLKVSNTVESLKKQLRDLKVEIERANAREETLKCFSAKFCDEQEGIFRTTGSLASIEIARDYTVCARYLDIHYGRKEHFAYEVLEWIDEQ